MQQKNKQTRVLHVVLQALTDLSGIINYRYRTMELKAIQLIHSLPVYVEAILPPSGGFGNEIN